MRCALESSSRVVASSDSSPTAEASLSAHSEIAVSGVRRSWLSTAIIVSLSFSACSSCALRALSSWRCRCSSMNTLTLLWITRGSIGLCRKSTAPLS